jgi:hypothetical protein
MKITFDSEMMSDVMESGGKLLMSPEAEAKLADFKKFQKTLELFEISLKQEIIDKATAIDPNFTSIVGDNAKITYSFHGPKYVVDKEHIEEIPEGLIEEQVRYSPVSKLIELYEANFGKLPNGIIPADRKKSISITIKGE